MSNFYPTRFAIFGDLHLGAQEDSQIACILRLQAVKREIERGAVILGAGDECDRLAGYEGIAIHSYRVRADGNHDPGEGERYLAGPGWRVEHGDRLDPLWSRAWFLRPISWTLSWVFYRTMRSMAVGANRGARDRNFENRWLDWQEEADCRLLVLGHSHYPGIWRRGRACLAVGGAWNLVPPYTYVALNRTGPESWEPELVEVKEEV